MVRPSGTEPKIKVYCGAVYSDTNDMPIAIQEAEKHAQNLLTALRKIIDS
jgi:phosphomannomutase